MLDKGGKLSLYWILLTHKFCRKTSRSDFALSIQLLSYKIKRDKGPWKSRGQNGDWCSGGNFNIYNILISRIVWIFPACYGGKVWIFPALHRRVTLLVDLSHLSISSDLLWTVLCHQVLDHHGGGQYSPTKHDEGEQLRTSSRVVSWQSWRI